MDLQPWIHKYLPKRTDGIISQPAARIKQLVTSWTRKSKPLFLWGPTGTGKTATAQAIATELGLELIEINASDSRKASMIDELVGGALKQGSLFGTSKLILIDEVDGLSGVKDRGGLPALVKLLKNMAYPVIITGEDAHTRKLKALRKVSECIEYQQLKPAAVAERLKTILKEEKVKHSDEDVMRIARNSGGDLRAAINDCQAASQDGKLRPDALLLGEREKKETMQNALLRVFKTTSAEMARGAFDRVDADINNIMLWLDHNLPAEYSKPLDLQRGYEALAQADVYLGRIRRWQYYRYYVYAYDQVTAGVATAKDEKYKGVTQYKETTRLLQIWMAKQKNAKKKAIAEKIGAKTHCSTKRALGDIPYVQQQFMNGKGETISEYLDLDAEETNWLSK